MGLLGLALSSCGVHASRDVEDTVARDTDPATLAPSGTAMLDPDALTRHAVCVGMTGSGKTGLGIGLLESLAGAGVPILVIDPRGIWPTSRWCSTSSRQTPPGLLGRTGDPLTDPRAILLAHLLCEAFAAGRVLLIDVLVPQVVDPPFERLGYFPVDEAVPPRCA